jgi:signal transduction histidine kinase/putative methionine-R-sulfoxide reductase with GAF domain
VEDDKLRDRLEYLHERVTLLEKRFNCLRTVAASVGSRAGIDDVLGIVAQQAARMLDAERATIFLVDDKTGELEARIIVGPELRHLRLRRGQGIAGWVAREGKTANIKDAYKDSRFDPSVDQESGFLTHSILCQPIINYRGRTVGVIQILNKRSDYFTMDDQDLLSTLTTQATVYIENSQYFSELRDANIAIHTAQEGLKRNYARLETLFRIQARMTQTWERGALIEGVLSELTDVLQCEVGALLLTTESPTRLFVKPKGKDPYMALGFAEGGILGKVARTGEGVLGGGPASELLPILHPQLDVDVRGVVAEPLLRSDGERIGALALADRTGEVNFSNEDAQIVKIVARQLSAAIERLAQHEELTRSNNLALIGGALSGVLHDLKSPMSIISGFVQLMEGEDDTSERRRHAENILRQFKLVSTMTQEVLAFARGETQILKRSMYPQAFLDEMEQLLQQEFSGRNIALKVENLCRQKFKADEGKMKRLFFNIARNARDAMPEGGTFTIRVTEEDSGIVFRFSDTGHGIPEEIRGRLFQSFVTQGKKDGTGLGLAIVKSIVEQHKGSVSYETGPTGTTFIVTLPRE